MRQRILGMLFLIFAPQLLISDLAYCEKTTSKGVSQEEASAIARKEVVEGLERFKDSYNKRLLEIAEQRLKLSQDLLQDFAWGGGFVTACLAILTFFGIKVSGRWIQNTMTKLIEAELSAFREKAGDQLEKVRRTIEGDVQKASQATLAQAETEIRRLSDAMKKAEDNVSMAQARLFNRIGLQQWRLSRNVSNSERKQLLRGAINDTEKALELNPTNEGLLTQIKSNLSFYYAELEVRDKRDIALNYAQQARDLAQTYGHRAQNWIVNHAFVKMKYASNRGELEEAIALMEALQKDYPEFSEEIRTYLEEARRKLTNF